MSRFPLSRWNRVLVWTGAATAWGTAFVAAKVEPARSAEESVTAPPAVEESSIREAVVPTAPPQGLVILRYTPVAEPLPEVRTVYVERSAAPTSGRSTASKSSGSSARSTASPPPPASPPATTVPAPTSSGS